MHPLIHSKEYMLQDCSKTFSCDDLVWTIRAGVSAVAGRGDAAWSNLTQFLNTDRHRLQRNGTLYAPGCSEPCAHCQPCVGPNTLVEEGANPILEGGIVIAANLQDMLLADYIVPSLYPSHNQTLVKVFPAVPSCWTDANFFRLRCLNGMLVSAVRRHATTAWVEVISESGYPVVLDVDFASTPLLHATSTSTRMRVLQPAGGGGGGGGSGNGQEGGRGKYLVSGIPKGGSAILHVAGVSDFAVSALPGNASEFNYYGYHV